MKEWHERTAGGEPAPHGRRGCRSDFGGDPALYSERAEPDDRDGGGARAGSFPRTVYRYFPTTEALLFASSIEASGGLLDRLASHVAGIGDPVEMVIEAIAFTVEQLPRERYLSVVLSSRQDDLPSGVSPETVKAFGRAILAEIGRGWATEVDERTLEELIEWTLAILHWTLLESTRRSRRGGEFAPLSDDLAWARTP